MFVRQPKGWLRPDRRRLSAAAREKLRRKACIEIITCSPPGEALDRAQDRHRRSHPGADCALGLVISPDASHFLLAHGDQSIVFAFETAELHRARVEAAAYRFLEQTHRRSALQER